jgi:hypothetical protein
MGDDMSKTMSRALAAAAVLAVAYALGTGPAAAMDKGTALTRALADDDFVPVAQRRRGKAKRGQSLNISQEHKQKIRQNVPAEYHQYLPKSITGGAQGGAGGAPGMR